MAFVTDIAMVVLVILNLIFIIFDWNFGYEFFRHFLKSVAPPFYQFYATQIHPNFLLYDLFFVSIFVTELLVRWGLAIKRRTYYKWFFYPFVHWYDVLGCIPLGAFRSLRFLRIVSMTIRLHKMGAVDIRHLYVYQLGYKYYKIVMEEISDRVVLNVLDGLQEEIRYGSPVTDKLITTVIKPHQDTLTVWLSHRVKKVTEHNYEQYRDEIKEYIESAIREAVQDNKEVKNIRLIPVLGKQVSDALQESVSDITFNVINSLVRDLASDRNNKVIQEITDILFDTLLLEEEDKELNEVTKDIFIRSVDLIKEHVEIKQWRLREERKRQRLEPYSATA